MKGLLCLALLFPALISASPIRVRLLSVTDNTARIRVDDGAPETRINHLVHSLHTSGVTSFILEANNDTSLNKLRSQWLDTGIKKVIIRSPEPPSSPTFPQLDPITALSTLRQIDRQIATELKLFKRHRAALVDLVFEHGFPESPDTKLADLTQQYQTTDATLKTFLKSSLEERLAVAALQNLPGNPVAKHLASHQKARAQHDEFTSSGFGPKHPNVVAAREEVEITRQLAIDELDAIEEALQVEAYQLDQRIRHFDDWKKLSQPEFTTRQQQFEQARSAYDKSLHRILRMKAAKKTAERSLKGTE